jgi:hypothetical protein
VGAGEVCQCRLINPILDQGFVGETRRGDPERLNAIASTKGCISMDLFFHGIRQILSKIGIGSKTLFHRSYLRLERRANG